MSTNKGFDTVAGLGASYDNAYHMVIAGHEGGYANDPDDPGGETYAGVARKFHPDWEGWSIIDEYKDSVPSHEFHSKLRSSLRLRFAVKEFFKLKYWTPIQGDALATYSSILADEMFDISVHLGSHKAGLFIQRGLNVLNNRQLLYKDIKVDGDIGNKTLNALRLCSQYERINYLISIINILQGEHYIHRMEQNDTFEKYVGWFNRVNLGKY